jgi:hypothetical protein
MKKITITITAILLLIALPFFVSAQQKSPGDPGGEPTGSDPPLGGGAPLGGGLIILIGLGAIYGGKKTYKLYLDRKEEFED